MAARSLFGFLTEGVRRADEGDVGTMTLGGITYRERVLRSLDALPPFSPVFHRLLTSLTNEDVSYAQLSGIIEQDAVLTGNVLRLVNSALYGRRGTVSSVRQSLSIIGFAKLRNFALGLSVAQLWRKVTTAGGFPMSRFNSHSAATAVLADLLVQRIRVEAAEGAFAAGLLHDIGRLMIATSVPAEHESIRRRHLESPDVPLAFEEKELLGTDHVELADLACERWNLPWIIRSAVGQTSPAPETDAADLRLIVRCANQLSDHLGYSIWPEEAELAPHRSAVFERLRLAEEEQAVLAEFETEVTNLLRFN